MTIEIVSRARADDIFWCLTSERDGPIDISPPCAVSATSAEENEECKAKELGDSKREENFRIR